MADNDLHLKILVCKKTLYFLGEILVAISPTLIFLFGCSVLVRQFIKTLLGRSNPEGTNIIEVIITGSIVIQLMRVWSLTVTSVQLLAEFVCQKFLEECRLLTEATLLQEACIVFDPWISCFVVCTAISLLPWSMLVLWNTVYQYHLQQDLIAWMRGLHLQILSRNEMGISVYFLQHPVDDEQAQRELMRNHGRVRGKRRSKDRQQRNLTRSTSSQNHPDSITPRLEASQSV
ncbi:uncharacterized protein LOC111046694 isoform X2 [Nilaparvata lugens]|uniref:uncharacterized protein LOC111046694 isoform X2 n=1 Tax=Nilaparvata lugens TaxID=108931 RepID=UPI00193D6B59|nr:uncharacterized protein LOC111046694 isoform X2 [Nilaparvata lugens]